ncbi:uncharacterized protein [Palaemon carinicauda]
MRYKSFIRFSHLYLVFTLEEEHCTTQEELEMFYQKFCKRRNIRKASLLDMKTALISANIKCIDLKHAGGGECCVFLGVQLLKNIVKKDKDIRAIQINEATTLLSNTKTNGAESTVIEDDKVEKYQYCVKAPENTSISVSDVAERNGKVNDVASHVGVYPKYSSFPNKKDDQELVDNDKTDDFLDVTVNNEITDQYSLLKGNQLEKICTPAESSLDTDIENLPEEFAPLYVDENVELLCDTSVSNRPTLYEVPRSADTRQGNISDQWNLLSGSPINDRCTFKSNRTYVKNKHFIDVEGNGSMNYAKVENSSTMSSLNKKPKRTGELSNNVLATKQKRWVVGVKLENIRVCEVDGYLDTGTEKRFEKNFDKSIKRPEKENLIGYEVEIENKGNCERLQDYGSDQYVNEKGDCSVITMTVPTNSALSNETRWKKSNLPLRENQARNTNNVSNSEQWDDDVNNFGEKDENYLCGTQREKDQDEIPGNYLSELDSNFVSDSDLQRNYVSKLLDHSSGTYLPPRNAHFSHEGSDVESTFEGFNSPDQNVTCKWNSLLQKLNTEMFGIARKRIKIEEPDSYLDHDSENQKVKCAIEDNNSMMSYLRERGKPKRLVSGVLLRDIRRYPQYQSKINFYKDEFGDWILVRPLFMYDGFESFRKFIKANICFTGKPHNLIMRGDLYTVYKRYCSKCSYEKASLEDIEHHFSVIGIRSHHKFVESFTPELVFSGLSWKNKTLLNKFGNNNFNVIIHDYSI